MKYPTLLKIVSDKEEALELMDYLYCEKIAYNDIISADNGIIIKWYDKDNNLIGKWTSEYKNLMISKILLDI